MKRIILILSIFMIGLGAQAASGNFLHTIMVEGTDDGYNIVLKTDSIPEVKKTLKGTNSLILDIKGVTTSGAVNAVYKSTSDINGLVIENLANDELKVYIQAKDIAGATILAQTSSGDAVIVSERFPVGKVLWTLVVLGILGLVVRSAKEVTEYENSIVIKRDIKDREIELYKNFQRELALMPDINCKIKSVYASNVMPKSRRNYRELVRR